MRRRILRTTQDGRRRTPTHWSPSGATQTRRDVRGGRSLLMIKTWKLLVIYLLFDSSFGRFNVYGWAHGTSGRMSSRAYNLSHIVQVPLKNIAFTSPLCMRSYWSALIWHFRKEGSVPFRSFLRQARGTENWSIVKFKIYNKTEPILTLIPMVKSC